MSDNSKMPLGNETEWVEYKKSTSELKEAVISIAAILNKHGEGKLFFGVKNDGTVVGQIVSDDTLRSVSQAIRYHISPTIYPTIQERNIDGKTVIQIEFSGSMRPYTAYNIPRILEFSGITTDSLSGSTGIVERDGKRKEPPRRKLTL